MKIHSLPRQALDAQSFTDCLRRNIEESVASCANEIARAYAQQAYNEVEQEVRTKIATFAMELFRQYEVMSDGHSLRISVNLKEPSKEAS